MGMTDRDRKVLAAVIVLVVLGGFWFLVLGKKRGEIKTAQEAQTAAQTELAAAQAAEQATLKVAKVKPVAYSRLLRLGKAIPADSDFQSLLVQLNDVTTAADVDFVSLSVSAGADGTASGATGSTTCDVVTGATGEVSPATGSTGETGSTSKTWVGKSVDKAEGSVAVIQRTNDATEAAAKAKACADSPTITDIVAQASGLKSTSYSLSFRGSFYNLRDVYNGILDLVEVHNERVKVTGRLLDIGSIQMAIEQFPALTATVILNGYQLPVVSASNGTELNATATSPEPAAATAPPAQ